MIGKLDGIFGGTTPEGAVIVEVGGVGYAVFVPLLAQSGMVAGQKVSLFIHTAVREDAIDLYGLPTQGEIAFFKQLIGVSGIGPKSALGILNVADAATLKSSIASGDTSMLTKVYGIGKKSAERIMVELRDKFALEAGARGEKVGIGEDAEVIEALMALGYSAQESRKALKEVEGGVSGVKERLNAALKHIGRGT